VIYWLNLGYLANKLTFMHCV